MSETVTQAAAGQMAGQATLEAGAATGGVKILLRLEGLTLFAGMVGLYAIGGGSWWLFAAAVPGAGRQLCRLSGGPRGRRLRLQCRAQLPGAGGADDGRLRLAPTR